MLKDRRLSLLFLLVVALGLRLLVAVAFYTDDLTGVNSGDYILYRIGAEHIRDYGDFSNSLFLSRTPLFPLMIFALRVDDFAVLIANVFLGALIAPVTLLLARRVGLSDRLALAAGLIVVVDPASLRYSAFLGTEPLANLFVVLALLAVLTGVAADSRRREVICGLAGGVALVLAMLARPSNYLLWTGVGLWLLVAYRKQWAVTLTFALVSLIGLGAYTVHNGLVFGNYTMSTVGTYTMVYYRAASIEHLATGNDMILLGGFLIGFVVFAPGGLVSLLGRRIGRAGS